MFKNLLCKLGIHKFRIEKRFTFQKRQGLYCAHEEIYGLVCQKCGTAKCSLLGNRPKTPNPYDNNHHRDEARAWLESKIGPVATPFVHWN